MTQGQSGYEGIDELGRLNAVIKLLAKLEEGGAVCKREWLDHSR